MVMDLSVLDRSKEEGIRRQVTAIWLYYGRLGFLKGRFAELSDGYFWRALKQYERALKEMLYQLYPNAVITVEADANDTNRAGCDFRCPFPPNSQEAYRLWANLTYDVGMANIWLAENPSLWYTENRGKQ